MDTVLYLGVDLGTAGSVIGGHYDGVLKVYQGPQILVPDALVALTDAAGELGLEMLQTTGYPARAPSRLFSDFEEVDGDVGAVLAGDAVFLSTDTYGKLAGDQTTVALTVRWELYDPTTRRVTYSRSTSAKVSTSGISAHAFKLAFTSSLSQVLADPQFRQSTVDVVAHRMPNPSRATQPGNNRAFRRAIPRDSELITITSSRFLLPSGDSPFELVGPAVVSLRGSSALGSAFVISRDGLALTNHHVVDRQRTLTALFPGGRERPARVVRTNEEADIALIEIACEEDCWTVSLDEEDPAVGSDLLVIGTPLTESLSHTMTRGIVSGLRLYSGVTLIQTDAAVNPGNSGAPMVDATSGRVLGIVTSKIVGDQIEGLSFGVAIDDALRVVGVVVTN